MAVVTMLDNGKLLKYMKLENGELKPFFEVKKTEMKGKCELSEEPIDWPSKINKGDEYYHSGV